MDLSIPRKSTNGNHAIHERLSEQLMHADCSCELINMRWWVMPMQPSSFVIDFSRQLSTIHPSSSV